MELSNAPRIPTSPERELRIETLIGRMEHAAARRRSGARHGERRGRSRHAGAHVLSNPSCLAPSERVSGLEPALPGPEVSVLRTANHRAFCARLGQTLPGSAYIYDMETLSKLIEEGGRTASSC